jgi:ATP-dependent DNA helicase RecG
VHPKRPAEIFPLFAATTSLSGVGTKLAAVMEKRVGSHVIDVLRHLPIGLIDRSKRPSVVELTDDMVATFEVLVVKHDRPPRGVRRPYRVFCDTKGGTLELVFFHAHDDFIGKQLPIGEKRLVSGRIELFQGRAQMAHPDHIVSLSSASNMPVFEPIYPLTAGLTQKVLQRAIKDALGRIPNLPEWISPELMKKYGWPDFATALRIVHTPKLIDDISPITPARARLAYDELLANQLALQLVRQNAAESISGRAYIGDGKITTKLESTLTYDLTNAQKRAISEITADQAAPRRMLRMLQGDVGAGKTVVALWAMLTTMEAGAQAALLAPTEVLARQHYASISALLGPLGIDVGLLLGQGRTTNATTEMVKFDNSTTTVGRKLVLEALAQGKLSLVVGTHALLSEAVRFHDLGLAVVDEQHRFGVRQRILLGQKGTNVDLMVMTATPIPRSLAMTAYGDLDHSRLDEKPIGRLPIDTRVVASDRLEEVFEGLRRALGAGKRAYWICPLVEESDKLDIAAAEERFCALGRALPEITVVMAHGKMKTSEKDAAMQAFRDGSASLLVATTVVEVGVDVPEASIIVIEHAERFGLAQLHQLRGRVGRGNEKSSCLLVYQGPLNKMASERLGVMRTTNDGFIIAEKDLDLRGPGEFLGQRQSGMPEFALADLGAHRDLLATARKEATRMLETGDTEQLELLLSLFERDSAVKFLASG